MKKKIVVLVMASALALSACGTKETAQTTAATEVATDATDVTDVEDSSDAESSDVEESDETDADVADFDAADGDDAVIEDNGLGGLVVDKSGDTVNITYPGAEYTGMEAEQVEQLFQAQGAEEVTVNDDGTISVVFTQEGYQSLMDQTKMAIDMSIEQLPTLAPSVKEVTNNEEYTEFTIMCDGAAYTEADSETVLGLVALSAGYQALDGADAESIKVVVDMIDADSEEVLYHFDSTELN